jgi:GTP-binding protein
VACELRLTSYGLGQAEERGTPFVGPGVVVYEDMVVGEQPRPGDLVVNLCKVKHVSSVRSSNHEVDERLSSPRVKSLDKVSRYLGSDELLEVTPDILRTPARTHTHAAASTHGRRRQ